MKIIKFGIFALTLFSISTAFSQQNAKQNASIESEKLAVDLKLDDRQKSLVKELNIANSYFVEETNANPNLSDEQKLEKIKINFKKNQDQIKGILTLEQKEKYNKLGRSSNH